MSAFYRNHKLSRRDIALPHYAANNRPMRCGIIILTLCAALPALTDAVIAQDALIEAARARVGVTLVYDPAYVSLPYPGGDVANDRGVCTDVLIRSLRAAYGYDLQKQVHQDMAADFKAYPDRWGLKGPDRNIDHRRVPNLETFFSRQNADVPVGASPEGFLAGDIVTWRVSGWMPHIGVVSDKMSDAGVPLIIHNMGWGAREEDILMRFPIQAQFRFHPKPVTDDADN